MNPEKKKEKAVYTKPSLTVHGNVEAITQTGLRCVRHRVRNCCICHSHTHSS